jgi:hypothetical protein
VCQLFMALPLCAVPDPPPRRAQVSRVWGPRTGRSAERHKTARTGYSGGRSVVTCLARLGCTRIGSPGILG